METEQKSFLKKDFFYRSKLISIPLVGGCGCSSIDPIRNYHNRSGPCLLLPYDILCSYVRADRSIGGPIPHGSHGLAEIITPVCFSDPITISVVALGILLYCNADLDSSHVGRSIPYWVPFLCGVADRSPPLLSSSQRPGVGINGEWEDGSSFVSYNTLLCAISLFRRCLVRLVHCECRSL